MFDGIKLSRNSWHYRLQVRYFGKADYTNFCPYFWLTIFCLLTSPFFFLVAGSKHFFTEIFPVRADALAEYLAPAFKWLGWAIEKFLGGFINLFDTVLCDPLEKVTLTHLSDERLLDIYRKSRDYYMKHYDLDEKRALEHLMWDAGGREAKKKWLRLDEKFQTFKTLAGDDWEARLKEAEERIAAKHKFQREEEDRRAKEKYEAEMKAEVYAAKRKKALNTIVAYTQYFVKALGVAMALLILKGLWKLVVWMAKWDWQVIGGVVLMILKAPYNAMVVIWHVKWVILGTVGLLAVVMLLIAGLVLLIKKCDLELNIDLDDYIMAFCRFVDRSISAIASPVIALGKFLWEAFLMFKKNHCPQIQWVD